MGIYMSGQGNPPQAVLHYRKAIEANPGLAKAYHNLGHELARSGQNRAAISCYLEALRIDPDYAAVHNNLGNALMRQGEIDRAINHYTQAVRPDKSFDKTHRNLGLALLRKGKIEAGIFHLEKAYGIISEDQVVRESLRGARSFLIDIGKASAQFRKALRFDPDAVERNDGLEAVSRLKYEMYDLISRYLDQLSLQPFFERKQFNMENVFAVKTAGREYDGALERFQRLAVRQPGHRAATYHIACILAKRGETASALEWFTSAVKAGDDIPFRLEKDRDLDNLKDSNVYKEITGRGMDAAKDP